MATTLGKRKRKTVTKQKNIDDEPTFDQDAQEIFRRHFEAQFKPLPEVRKPAVVEEVEENDSEENLEWNGISDDEDGIQVVEHTDAESRIPAMSKEQLKSFMVSSRSCITACRQVPDHC